MRSTSTSRFRFGHSCLWEACSKQQERALLYVDCCCSSFLMFVCKLGLPGLEPNSPERTPTCWNIYFYCISQACPIHSSGFWKCHPMEHYKHSMVFLEGIWIHGSCMCPSDIVFQVLILWSCFCLMFVFYLWWLRPRPVPCLQIE